MRLRIFLTIFAIAALFATANSQIVFTENFDYTAGDSIGAHGWIPFSGSTNNIMVVTPGLTYTGYPCSGIGNACRVRNNGIDAYKSFTSDSVTSGSVYVAFMIKVDTAKTGDYFFTMNPPSSNTSFQPRLYVKDSSGSLSFGIGKGPNAVLGTYGPNSFSYGTTYLVVAKYKFNTGTTTDDELSLFVFTSPTMPSTEPTTPYVGPITSSTTDIMALSKVVIRQGSSSTAPSLTLDGIKVATSWGGITTSIIRNEITAKNFELSQNYPNPFNPVTNIRFALPTNGFATLKVYDILGNEVNTLVNAQMNQGVYTVNMNGTKLSSGTYMCKLTFKSVNGTIYNDIMKMTLLK